MDLGLILSRLKKILQDNLSLSSKLCLRGLLATSTRAGKTLLHFPSRFATRVINAAGRRVGIGDVLAVKAYSVKTPALTVNLADALLAAEKPAPVSPNARIQNSIVIPVFNKAEFTFQCIEALRKEVDFSETEVIVVDNASTDETEKVLAHFANLVRVIRNEENRGFVDACNQVRRRPAPVW